MASKVFMLRRANDCYPASGNFIYPGELCPDEFTKITGLTIPVGGRIRVKLVVVKGRKG